MSTTRPVLDSHDETIRSQLARLKDTFFVALSSGYSDLKSFSKSWKSFLALVAEYSSILDATTHSMISSFAQMVITLATTLIDAEAIHHQLEAEISSLAAVEFKKLSIHDYEPMPDSASNGGYIEACYTWLLAHLHNPYPTKSMRLRICQETDSSLQDVDAWFKSARKHIGWNEIRRAHFETRFDMVKAATKFWKTSRTIYPSPYDEPPEGSRDHSYEFSQMESRAQSLYAHKFFPTSLATNLGGTVKHSSANRATTYPSPERTPTPDADQSFQSTHVPRKRRNSDAEPGDTYNGGRPQRPLKRTRIATPASSEANTDSCFPSPAHGSARELSFSLSPSVAPSPLPEIPKPTNNAEKRKRRMSDASCSDSDSSRVPRARRKRRANDDDNEMSERSTMVGLTREAAVATSDKSLVRTSASSSQTSQPLKRKRRLSDTAGDRPRKHPHHAAEMVPRLQTVSNPYPMTSSGPQDIPESLTTDLSGLTGIVDFEGTQNLEIETFDYSSMPGLNDFLSQMDATSADLDPSRKLDLAQVVEPEIDTFQVFRESSNSLALLALDIPTTNQPFIPSYDDLFPDIQMVAHSITPGSWQYPFVGNNQTTATTESSFIASFNNHVKFSMPQITGISPLDLLPDPLQSANATNVIADHPSITASDIDFGGASPISFTMQKIQNLQAQIAMYQTQLSQCGVVPF